MKKRKSSGNNTPTSNSNLTTYMRKLMDQPEMDQNKLMLAERGQKLDNVIDKAERLQAN